MGMVDELITGRNGVVRGAKLRAGKSYLEQAILQYCAKVMQTYFAEIRSFSWLSDEKISNF